MWCCAPSSDYLTQRLWGWRRNTAKERRRAVRKRSQDSQADNSGSTMQPFSDLWLCGYSPDTTFLKYQPSDIFLTCSLLHSNFCGFFLDYSQHSIIFLPYPSHLKTTLVQTWKYNLVRCFMHSSWKCFPAIWDFSHHTIFFPES